MRKSQSRALKEGKHALVEKPPRPTVGQALKYEFGEIYYAKASCIRRPGNPGGWFSDMNRSGDGPLIDIGVLGMTKMLCAIYESAEKGCEIHFN